MEVSVFETTWVQVVKQVTQEDSIAQSYGQDLNFRVWPIGLVVRRDDLALDQPVHTVPPQVVLRHSQGGCVFYGLLNGQDDDCCDDFF